MRALAIAALSISVAFFSGAARSQTQKTVTVVAYSGVFQDRYTEAVIAPFMRANPDIKVEYFAMPNSAQMLGTMRAQKSAPQADIVIMDSSFSKAATDDGLLTPIDANVSKNFDSLYPAAIIKGIDGVGITFDNLVLLYNTDSINSTPKSWMSLADKSYNKKVVIPGMPDYQGLALAIILDHARGGTDYLTNLDRGLTAVGEIAPNVLTWEPKPEIYPIIVSGQAIIGVGWNARAQINADISNGRLAATVPVEGTVFQINTINLIANSPAPDAAKKFIDYALSTEAQSAFSESMYYAPTNSKAEISDMRFETWARHRF